MATITTLAVAKPYYTVRVEFADQQFNQILISFLVNQELADQLQNYADSYEAEWLVLQEQQEGGPE